MGAGEIGERPGDNAGGEVAERVDDGEADAEADEVERERPADGLDRNLPLHAGGAKTVRWLDHWRFWATTGIASDHVRFCLERRDKAQHCRELGVTHFIDDRFDVLGHLRGLVPRLYLFGHQSTPAPHWVTPVVDWPAVLAAVLPELATGAPRADGSTRSRAELR